VIRRRLSAIVGLLLTLACLASQAQNQPRIAIIIDDLGYALSLGRRVTELPGPVACAVLPATPRGKALAMAANAAGKEVLLHLPLEALREKAPQEPGRISLDMSRGEFARVFASDLQSVPHAIGVNSHRGSLLTQHPGHMSWLMEEINASGNLFFVDSYTTHQSVALKLAYESGVPAVKRDVFLDPDDSPETVAREFERLKKMARQRGMAVGIGHPYIATIELLERELPRLADEGIELISISELVALNAAKTMTASGPSTGADHGLVR
jgi:polysaccharide deacetylase 2 family uncharacterized protein YibQ